MNISRRNFLIGGGSAVAAGAVAAGLSGCSSDSRTKTHDKNISTKTNDGRTVGSKGNGNYKIIEAKDIEGAVTGNAEVWKSGGKTVPTIEGYMPFKGYKTYFRIAGNGNNKKAPLLVLHGGPGGGHNPLEVMDALAHYENRQVIYYDQIGCGKSFVEGHKEWWNKETWMEELQALRDYLGLDQCHLIGQSWGGMLIVCYLIDKKPNGICSGIITSGHCSSSLWASEQRRLLKYLSKEDQEAIANAEATNNYKSDAFKKANDNYYVMTCNDDVSKDPNAPECCKRGVVEGHDDVYQTAWGLSEYNPTGNLKDFEYIDKLGDIKESILVINGTNDMCTPLVAQSMYNGIADCQWKMFQSARHRCYYDAYDEYMPYVDNWMREHE